MAIRTRFNRLRTFLETRRGHEDAQTTVRWHSVSSCREYDLCPRRYRYAYVERLPPDRPTPDGWRYGTVVHRALEAAYRARAAGESESAIETAAVAALHDAWGGEQLPDDDTGWRDRAERLVRRTVASDLLHADDILGVEHRFGAQFDDLTAFAGYADLVLRRDDHTIEIVDHKVTRNVADPETLRHDLQLNLYGWLAKHEWPWARRIIATHHYPPAATTTTVDLTDASIENAARELFATTHRAINDRQYLPTPGPHCANCCWAPRCPAAVDADSHSQATSPEAR